MLWERSEIKALQEILEDDNDGYLNENNKRATRTVEVPQNKSYNHVMNHEIFNNTQSLIKATKNPYGS